MLFGACDACNAIYVTAGLAPGETVCPECGMPLRFIRQADGLELCREALGPAATLPGTSDEASRRAA